MSRTDNADVKRLVAAIVDRAFLKSVFRRRGFVVPSSSFPASSCLVVGINENSRKDVCFWGSDEAIRDRPECLQRVDGNFDVVYTAVPVGWVADVTVIAWALWTLTTIHCLSVVSDGASAEPNPPAEGDKPCLIIMVA